MIASLGGFLNRKSDGFPGPQTMWIGLQRMMDIANAWLVFNEVKFEHICVQEYGLTAKSQQPQC